VPLHLTEGLPQPTASSRGLGKPAPIFSLMTAALRLVPAFDEPDQAKPQNES
jgi:hypothetical protein